MRPPTIVLLALSLEALACRRRAPAPTPRLATVAPASPPATDVRAGAADAAPAAPALVDLLHFTPSVAAVSSTVANPRDFPQHLVDGRAETAWNSRTGDLAGGWIAFRVPRDARVRRVELNAGFDRSTARADLFTANVRIARVRVLRDGAALGEFALDPDVRAPQPIALDAQGGDFRIEVVSVVPGTRADWRELCVSELRVFGVPGAERARRPTTPQVRVGSLDPPPAPPPPPPSSAVATLGPGPFESPEAYCARYDEAITPSIDARYGDGTTYPGPIAGPHCNVGARTALHDPTFVETVEFQVDDVSASVQSVGLVTPRGFFPLDITLDRHGHGDPGCGWGTLYLLEAPEVRGAALVLRAVKREYQSAMNGEGEEFTIDERWLWACHAAADGDVRCGPGALIAERRVDRSIPFDIDLDEIRWTRVHPVTISPAGEVSAASRGKAFPDALAAVVRSGPRTSGGRFREKRRDQ